MAITTNMADTDTTDTVMDIMDMAITTTDAVEDGARPSAGDPPPPVTPRHRALLQVWLSPSFPVGAFAYSHGLERAIEAGWIRDRAGLEAWLSDLIAHGSLRNDLILLATAWRAVRYDVGRVEERDPTSGTASHCRVSCVDPTYALSQIAELAAALQPSAERYLEATQQGASFIAQLEAAWPPGPPSWSDLAHNLTPTHAVALGYAAARHGIPLADTLSAYAVAFVGNLTSAAIRLSVIGQTDAQRVTAGLLDAIQQAAMEAEHATLDDLGAAAFRSDLASLQHETQHTRLFRS